MFDAQTLFDKAANFRHDLPNSSSVMVRNNQVVSPQKWLAQKSFRLLIEIENSFESRGRTWDCHGSNTKSPSAWPPGPPRTWRILHHKLRLQCVRDQQWSTMINAFILCYLFSPASSSLWHACSHEHVGVRVCHLSSAIQSSIWLGCVGSLQACFYFEPRVDADDLSPGQSFWRVQKSWKGQHLNSSAIFKREETSWIWINKGFLIRVFPQTSWSCNLKVRWTGSWQPFAVTRCMVALWPCLCPPCGMVIARLRKVVLLMDHSSGKKPVDMENIALKRVFSSKPNWCRNLSIKNIIYGSLFTYMRECLPNVLSCLSSMLAKISGLRRIHRFCQWLRGFHSCLWSVSLCELEVGGMHLRHRGPGQDREVGNHFNGSTLQERQNEQKRQITWI